MNRIGTKKALPRVIPVGYFFHLFGPVIIIWCIRLQSIPFSDHFFQRKSTLKVSPIFFTISANRDPIIRRVFCFELRINICKKSISIYCHTTFLWKADFYFQQGFLEVRIYRLKLLYYGLYTKFEKSKTKNTDSQFFFSFKLLNLSTRASWQVTYNG